MSQKNAVVATYQSHSQAEEALKELQKTGFDVKKLSIVGKDYHTEEKRRWILQCGRPDEAVGQSRALSRAVCGECCLGSAFFAIPGIGPVLVQWSKCSCDPSVVLSSPPSLCLHLIRFRPPPFCGS